ncbi:flagellar basal body rod protein FlgB [Liquorilactobacillus oeni]|uniref:Flagellar basal body rod protein FlgB n=2 Tax=Liquorilactobacillus oeni TaxID=303241 RepID=A0A0R1MBP8_9LACO|nr:flagellar basal body rod protein FlgB [Liquorilactobacillus oeni]AJA34212.1 flagellar basal-body rod protein FlgB [Liquorilactobacillus oeni]KRL05518.1 flagellar basal-body rod protein [Liquorilactobacillus oeni DSM 19972]
METYNMLKQALDVSAQRSELISSNIANVNTANYKAKRIAFSDQLNTALGMTTTHKTHMNTAAAGSAVVTNDTTAVKQNGNNVDLDVEMVNQSTNGLYYNALVSQLNGRYQMLNYVLEH